MDTKRLQELAGMQLNESEIKNIDIAKNVARWLSADVDDLTKQFAKDPQEGDDKDPKVTAVLTMINNLEEFVTNVVTDPTILKAIEVEFKKRNKVK